MDESSEFDVSLDFQGIVIDDLHGNFKVQKDRAQLQIHTLSDAISYLEHLSETQVYKAALENCTPLANTSGGGDSVFRRVFYGILPKTEQRRIFLNFISLHSRLCRVRALFGSPPYSFLFSEDCQSLRAAGFSPGRTNMSSSFYFSSSDNFGMAIFEDESRRTYKVYETSHAMDKNVQPVGALFLTSVRNTPFLDLVVKLPKQGRVPGQRPVGFPVPGACLLLRETTRACKLRLGTQRISQHIKIHQRMSRSAGSRTGLIRVTCTVS